MHTKSTLILGGARSGKSRFGERLALETGLEPVYIATAEAHDDEMYERIRQHQQDRADNGWFTVEEPLELAGAISEHAAEGVVIFVDCITLWLSNLMATDRIVAEETAKLIQAIEQAPSPIILISNEVGMGIVPMNELAREFRDEAGWLNQTLAASLPNCHFIIAGLSLPLKREGQRLVESLF